MSSSTQLLTQLLFFPWQKLNLLLGESVKEKQALRERYCPTDAVRSCRVSRILEMTRSRFTSYLLSWTNLQSYRDQRLL